MADRAATTIAQASSAGLFAEGEHLDLLDLGTPIEVAQEAEWRLLKAGLTPWWPAEGVDGPWLALAQTDLVLMRARMPELGRYYDRQRAIILREGVPESDLRQALWHELIHAERRHIGSTLTPEEHADVDRETSRRLG